MAESRERKNATFAVMAILRTASAGLLFLAVASYLLSPTSTPTDRPHGSLRVQMKKLVEERAELDRTLWAQEVRAQQAEQVFVRLWDDLRGSDRAVTPLVAFELGRMTIGHYDSPAILDGGLAISTPTKPIKVLSRSQWQRSVEEWYSQGFRLVQSEWHHSRFEETSQGPRSLFTVELHVLNDATDTRYILRGPLHVLWNNHSSAPSEIDASQLTLLSRAGPTPFTPRRVEALLGRQASNVILYDLDRDGRSDILLPSANLLLINKESGFEEANLASGVPRYVVSAAVADFTGDGIPDLISAGSDLRPMGGHTPIANNRLYLHTAETTQFTGPPTDITPLGVTLYQQPTMTVGDVDGDGDLDVWIGQYKAPYVEGSMPTPYYDANDGYPSYLLLNDGSGRFEDATRPAGLDKKRHRRTYSNSLVDLDDDLDLDLVVVSDFAGVDIYTNDGSGRFTDITGTSIDNNALFGMGHSFGDFDGDGRVDLYVIGMSSTTAKRLEAMGLERDDFPQHNRMRSEMSFGNRMYLVGAGPRLHQPAYKDRVARTGWSWGSVAFDADNDADLDLYVANGFLSRETATDYCTEFWRHDIYSGDSTPNPVIDLIVNRGLDREISWNGFEKNHLLLDTGDQNYLNVSFLMGTALEEDSRNVLSDDFNLDGRSDLLVVKRAGHPRARKWDGEILENQWDSANHWIGVRLYEEGHGFSPIGARISVRTADRLIVAKVVTGESFRSQQANLKHFGLGATETVDSIEVQWINGTTNTVVAPEIDRYHLIRPPRKLRGHVSP